MRKHTLWGWIALWFLASFAAGIPIIHVWPRFLPREWMGLPMVLVGYIITACLYYRATSGRFQTLKILSWLRFVFALATAGALLGVVIFPAFLYVWAMMAAEYGTLRGTALVAGIYVFLIGITLLVYLCVCVRQRRGFWQNLDDLWEAPTQE